MWHMAADLGVNVLSGLAAKERREHKGALFALQCYNQESRILEKISRGFVCFVSFCGCFGCGFATPCLCGEFRSMTVSVLG